MRIYRSSVGTDVSIGLVPTMGCLHAGHFSLVEAAMKENDLVIVSLFVNPAQFEPDEDYHGYPRKFDEDTKSLMKQNVDVVFAPTEAELYDTPHRDLCITTPLNKRYCGFSRPHHFDGVLKVIAKLLHLVCPHQLYLGEKDYQQLILIEKMINELDFQTKIRRCATIREKNGLAMSSRNQYLSLPQREQAAILYASLRQIRNKATKKALFIEVVQKMFEELLKIEKSIKIDYIIIGDKINLEPLEKTSPNGILLAAMYINKVRLIDNIALEGVL